MKCCETRKNPRPVRRTTTTNNAARILGDALVSSGVEVKGWMGASHKIVVEINGQQFILVTYEAVHNWV